MLTINKLNIAQGSQKSALFFNNFPRNGGIILETF